MSIVTSVAGRGLKVAKPNSAPSVTGRASSCNKSTWDSCKCKRKRCVPYAKAKAERISKIVCTVAAKDSSWRERISLSILNGVWPTMKNFYMKSRVNKFLT